ncbi:carbohydrate esterase family 16 protein, partial [Cylindrobasidium torrendii FP15055 ss-10]
AADGGIQWPYYLGLYGNYTIWNYAVGGAVCNESLTPLNDRPDVASGQPAWFVEDHIASESETEKQRLLLDPDSFVVIIFIGTNDVGIGSFITNDQAADVTLADLADCQVNAIRDMHRLGARHFILNALTPLHLTKLYSNSSDPTIYWPKPHDGEAWYKDMYNIVHRLNRLLSDRVSALNAEWRGNGEVQWFDTYALFEELYFNPALYFNGSVPANTTGHCHQCPDPDDYRLCGIGDCTLDERDSYMFWDELHPSEQTGRNLAMEMHKKIGGQSRY